MKNQNSNQASVSKSSRPASFASALAFTAITALSAASAFAQDAEGEATKSGPNDDTFWGAGIGLVFNSIPISDAEFVSPFTQLYYSWYITDPNESFRTAVSMGLYGFGMVLPVPKVSAEMFLGSPNRDIQGKVGVGGFYDIAVGGHGGVALETGVRIANKYDITFVTVPAGTDSKRDYLEFVGLRDKEEADAREAAGKEFVKMPYYGVFFSVVF